MSDKHLKLHVSKGELLISPKSPSFPIISYPSIHHCSNKHPEFQLVLDLDDSRCDCQEMGDLILFIFEICGA